MKTVEIILLIVTLHLAINLMTALCAAAFRSKRKDDIELVLAYLENNEIHRLGLLKSFIPETENQLMEMKSKIASP